MVKPTKNTSWIKLQIKSEIYRFIHNLGVDESDVDKTAF